jgi:hypothetical protein
MIRRSKERGVRAEVLRRVRGLEVKCVALEREICSLALGDRLRDAMRRIAQLEEQEHAGRRRAS